MLHKVVFSYLFLGFLRMSRFALLTGLQDVNVSQKQFFIELLYCAGGAQGDVMGTALDDGGGRNQRHLALHQHRKIIL